MTTKTIAITGATGQFGAIALDLLRAKHANVIALVRNPAKISDVEARQFDYSKTEGQVETLQGVDTLILVSSSEVGQRIQQHKNVIEAAKKQVLNTLFTPVYLVPPTTIPSNPSQVNTLQPKMH